MRFRRQYTLYARKMANGKTIWYFRIYLPDGTRRAKSTGCTSKEKAMMFVENILDDENLLRQMFETDLPFITGYENRIKRKRNVLEKLRNMTFEEFAKPWWLWDTCPYVLARREAGTEKHPLIKRSTVEGNRRWMERYLIPYFSEIRIQSISVRMVNRFLSELKKRHHLANKTINNIRQILSTMLSDAVARQLIDANPVSGTLPRAVDEKKQELLTDDEWFKLFKPENMNEIWGGNLLHYAYSFVAGLTGLRAGELLALTIEDVTPEMISVNKSYDSKHGIITTTKTSEERNIPITHEIYRMLYVSYHSHPKGKASYIFSSDGATPIKEGIARKAFYKALEKIGISEEERARRGITFHSWRHKFATDCVKANMHPLKIMALTGHKNAEMLFRYTDLNVAIDLETEIKSIQREKMKNIRI